MEYQFAAFLSGIRMKRFMSVVFFVSMVAADRLENTYLPPSGAQRAGGDGDVLNAPEGLSHRSREYGDSGPNGGLHPDATATTLRFENENAGDGSYKFEFETENRISQQEIGELRDFGGEEGGATVVRGSYAYMAPDGVMYNVEYIADENGFQPIGEHIPNAGVKNFENQNGYPSNNGLNQQYSTRSNQKNEEHDVNLNQEQGYPLNSNEREHFKAQQHGFTSSTNLGHSSNPNSRTNGENDQSEINLDINQDQEFLRGTNSNTDFTSFHKQSSNANSRQSTQGYSYEHPGQKSTQDKGFVSGFKSNTQREFTSSHQNHTKSSNSNIPRGFTSSQNQPNNQNANVPRGFTSPVQDHSINSNSNIPREFTSSHREQSNIPRGFATSNQDHPINSNLNIPRGVSSFQQNNPNSQIHGVAPSHQDSHVNSNSNGPLGFAPSQKYSHGNSNSNSPRGFAPSHQDSHVNSNFNSPRVFTSVEGYPSKSGPNTSSHQGLGYPHKTETQPQNHDAYPSNQSQGSVGYPSAIPEHQLGEFLNDNIDSSHQHDHAEEEEDDDAVVVEAAARSFQPPQVPSGRATSGQQAFDEKTGYQY